MKKLEIKNISIEKLKEYDNNPRIINEEAVEAVKNSIKEFGFINPVVIDKNNVVVAGHTRLKAGKKLNLKDIPCVIVDELTEKQVDAFRLIDNKTSELTLWDKELLENELIELEDWEIDINDIVNFNTEEFINMDELGDSFELDSSEKPPYGQVTFTLSNKQHEIMMAVLADLKNKKLFDNDEINENKNGNAIMYLVRKWAEQKI